jgi:hypothetical protein
MTDTDHRPAEVREQAQRQADQARASMQEKRDKQAARAEDEDYVERKYHEVEDSIQQGMDALARKRALPIFA